MPSTNAQPKTWSWMKSLANAGRNSRNSASSQAAGWTRRSQSGGEEARDLALSEAAPGAPEARSAAEAARADDDSIPADTACPVAAIRHFLPSRPCGRNASTATMMRKVPTTA